MNKIFSFFILFKYILSFNVPNTYFSENINNSNGRAYTIPEDGKNEFPCSCDLTENSCDYQCCCDDNCPENIIKYWKEKQKCINEVNTLNFFNYKCINEQLIAFKHLRKGTDELNESVKNKKCFGNDNSPKMKEIYKNLKDNVREKINKIYKDYIEEKILKTFNFNYADGNYIKSMTNRKFGLIPAENSNYFTMDNIFTIYSKGSYGECVSGRKIQFFENIRNLKCLMNIDSSQINEYCNSLSNLNIAGKSITNFNYYKLFDGIITEKIENQNSLDCSNNFYPVEINFIIETQKGKSIQEINIECVLDNTTRKQIPSTFSVYFKDEADENLILFSGTGGYLLNYPLLIKYELNTKDYEQYTYGYVMIGRDKNGRCRTGDENDLYKYLYEFDTPILFGQDYDYYCNFDSNDVKNYGEFFPVYFYKTLLVRKAIFIKYIGIYGSSMLNNTNNWIKVKDVNNIFEEPPYFKQNDSSINNNFYFSDVKDVEKCSNNSLFKFPNKIILNIYIGKIENSYIVVDASYNFNFICIDDSSNKQYQLIFKIKYNFIEKGKKTDNLLSNKPDLPTILPKLPKDLVDPIKAINVNI